MPSRETQAVGSTSWPQWIAPARSCGHWAEPNIEGRAGRVGPRSRPSLPNWVQRRRALAWLLAQGNDIAPIPGTKRVARVEENTAADRLELSAEQIARLNNLAPAAGERHDAGNMAVIDG